MLLRRGSQSEQVRSIQQWLVELGLSPGAVDGIFGDWTEKAVIRFQEDAGIYADGIVGPVTMDALEKAYLRHVAEQTSPGADSLDGTEERLQFVRCKADKYGEGYDRVYLRQDAAEAYNQVYEQVHALGGILTSSGGKRALDAPVTSNRSATSFHYAGLALDLYLWSGMEKPQKDPYVIRVADLEERRLEVFVRCLPDKVEDIEINDVVRYQDPGLLNRITVKGPYRNLTQIFSEAGFKPIPARRRFIDDGYPLAAEWWHFQYEKQLVPGLSTFGRELLKAYTRLRLEGTPPWRFRDRVFKINWF